MPGRILIVGGSIAAVTAASTLEAEGYDGSIVIASDETHAPYSRVPFSKSILSGRESVDAAYLQGLPDRVDLRLGQRAMAVDLDRRTVMFANGIVEKWGGLVIATGARARRLGPPGSGEHVVRDMEDVERLLTAAVAARTAIVIGSGFLAMETASTLVDRGITVSVISRAKPLAHLLGDWLSSLVTAKARAAGVTIITGHGALGVSPTGHTVRLESGVELSADLVISAIGDVPNVEWLAGLRSTDGIRADHAGVVAESVTAAGDVAATWDGRRWRRRPHWTNAIGSARTAALSLLGRQPSAPAADEYYWTEAFGLDLKISGALGMADAPEVIDGDFDESRALLRWQSRSGTTAVALNFRIPIVKLKALGANAPATDS